MIYDVIVVGGSYAGVSAAMQLARARRSVLVIDAAQRRNRFAAMSHGFLGQDGNSPDAIADQARRQLLAYPSVTWHDASAVAAEKQADVISIATSDGLTFNARRLILASGVTDELPDIPGLAERWGDRSSTALTAMGMSWTKETSVSWPAHHSLSIRP